MLRQVLPLQCPFSVGTHLTFYARNKSLPILEGWRWVDKYRDFKQWARSSARWVVRHGKVMCGTSTLHRQKAGQSQTYLSRVE
jgi:hypothetical protein